MKNSLIHRSIQRFFGSLVLVFVANSLSAQTGTLSVQQFHNTTVASNSKVTYSITISNGWSQGVSTVTSVVLKNLATGVNAYATAVGYTSANSFETIPGSFAAGSYELKVIVSTPKAGGGGLVSVTCVLNIWIGNKVYWENCFDMEPGVNQYSMKRTKSTVGQTYSYAQSFNVLNAGALGWVEMRKLNSNMNDSRVFLILEPMANPRSFTPTDNLTYIEFSRDNLGVSRIKVRYKQGSGIYRDSIIPGVAATDKVRFQRNANGSAILQINNLLATKFTFLVNITGALKITLLSKQLNDQADEISTSYSYQNTNYPLSTTFHSTNADNSNTGTITTFIAPLSGFTAPYNYFVTPSPMDDMKTIYKYLKDSIYTGGVDSTTFFRGSTSSLNFTSQLLPAGSYYSNVFDSKGVRVITNKVELKPANVYGELNRFENSNNEFISTSPDSYMTLNTYVTEEDRASLVYYITNTTADQSFGVLAENVTISGGAKSYSKLTYGFTLSGVQLLPVINGVTGSFVTPVTVLPNVPIELVFADGTVTFRHNGSDLKTEVLPSSFSYKSGAYIKSWGVPISINPVNLKFRPYKITAKVENNSCSSTLAKLTINYVGLHGGTITNPSFTLFNVTNDGIAPVSYDASVTNGEVYTTIPFGVYSLEGSFTIGATTYTNYKQLIYVGSKLSWDPYTTIQTWPVNNTATHYAIGTSAVSNTNTAKAISTNILDPQTTGWTVLTAPQFPFAISPFKRAQFFLNEAPIMASLNSFDNSTPCVLFFSGIAVTVTAANAGPANVAILSNYAPNVPLLIRRADNGFVRYRQNYTSLREVTNYSNARWKPAFFSQYASTGIREVYSSYPCKPYTTEMFAQLKYDMDGYYHIMTNGEIKFVFNQEYNDVNLTFNLYNSNDILIKTQANFPVQATTNGMNYLTLIVRNAYCIGKGFFYLEVINSKNEKMYLRFYNDFYDPTCPLEGQNGESGSDG